jgi:hypothetical protein
MTTGVSLCVEYGPGEKEFEREIGAIIRQRTGNAAPDWELSLRKAVMRLFGLR